MIAYLGLGSNLDKPYQQLNRAINTLSVQPQISIDGISPYYLSRPMGEVPQANFLNAVVAIQTDLPPRSLLLCCQHIEVAQHRTRETHWGPRTIDIDLLVMDGYCINEEMLTLPHPAIAKRDFVIEPLKYLAPSLIIPGIGPINTIQPQQQHIIKILATEHT